MTRAEQLNDLYQLLRIAEGKMGDRRRLEDPAANEGCPVQGVYFFFETGEYRESGDPRIVRVGTHAVSEGSRTTLWHRLRQHRGTLAGNHPGGGDHRGSVFRKHVGLAVLGREPCEHVNARATWGKGGSAPRAVRDGEFSLERQVSSIIGAMSLLWVSVPGTASAGSDRSRIERDAIALLSNMHKDAIDLASPDWLGLHSPYAEVRESGLWNVHHVGDRCDPTFLAVLGEYIDIM